MMRELKVTTIDHRIGVTLIPFIFFLAIMLALASPGQSQSAEKQFQMDTSQRTVTESKKGEEASKVTKKSLYQKMIGNVKRLVRFPKKSQPEEKQTKKTGVSVQSDFVINKKNGTEQINYIGESAINSNKDNIYDMLISVVKHQKVIESMNEVLIEKLSQKDETITSLKYTGEVLWNQLEESENKYWNTVTDKAYMEDELLAQLEESENKYWNTVTDKASMEDELLVQLEESEDKYWDTLVSMDEWYQQVKVLTEILDLKEYVIRTLEDKEQTLRAQLEANKKKFQEALAARDEQYQKAVKGVSSSAEPLFGYSPPATEK